MPISSIVDSTINLLTQTPTQDNFGVPLILALKTPWVDTVRTYNEASEMLSDGFVEGDAAYLAALAIKSQSPSPSYFKVAGCSGSTPQLASIGFKASPVIKVGQSYGVTINDLPYYHTAIVGDDHEDVLTAIAALINAGPAHTPVTTYTTGLTLNMSLAAGAGVIPARFTAWKNLLFKESTANVAIGTDLSEVREVDDDWYGLVLAEPSVPRNAAAAAWVQANTKLFAAESSDSRCEDPADTSDEISTMVSNGYSRTGVFYCPDDNRNFVGAALMAHQFTQDPGSDTWALKGLAGVHFSKLRPTAQAAIRAKGGNFYSRLGGLNLTQGKNGGGITASGEYFDVMRYVDWQNSDIGVRVLQVFASNPKVPYTDPGIDLLRGALNGSLQQGARQGGILAESIVIKAGKANAQSLVDKGQRMYRDLKWEAVLQGAIHFAKIQGTLTL